jgi:hypothetical protein
MNEEAMTGLEAEQSPADLSYPVQGDLRDLETRAPRIGKVIDGDTPRLAEAVAFRVPSVQLDGVQCGRFFLAAGSQVGLSHLREGTPRQDGYDFIATANGNLVVALADGLGSRPYSQVGARTFGELVVFLAAQDPGLTAAEYLTQAATVTGEFAQRNYNLDSHSIAFVGAVAVFDPQLCSIARVGDISAFARTDAGDFEELFVHQADTAANLVEASLPGRHEPEIVTSDSDRIVLATDGLAGDLRFSPAVREWLAKLWSRPVTGSAMNEALRFRRQGSHDDRTGVVVWRPVLDPAAIL